MLKLIIALVSCLSVIVGCANIKPYNANGKNNLFVNSKTDKHIQASIDIYHVDKACRLSHQGTVILDKPQEQIALLQNRLHYLVIGFSTSSFWSAHSSQMSQATLLTPEQTYHYQLNISHIDNIYNVELNATRLKSKKTTNLEMIDLDKCKSQ